MACACCVVTACLATLTALTRSLAGFHAGADVGRIIAVLEAAGSAYLPPLLNLQAAVRSLKHCLFRNLLHLIVFPTAYPPLGRSLYYFAGSLGSSTTSFSPQAITVSGGGGGGAGAGQPAAAELPAGALRARGRRLAQRESHRRPIRI